MKKLKRILQNNEKNEDNKEVLLKSIIIITSIILVFAFWMSLYYSRQIVDSYNGQISFSRNKTHFAALLIGNEKIFLEHLREGIEDEAEKADVAIEFFEVNDVSEGVEIIQLLVRAGVDGIITQGINNAEFIEVLNTVKDSKIPLVLVYTDAQSSGRNAFVGINPFDMGIEAARLLIESEGANGNVVFFYQSSESVKEDTTSKMQMLGFMDALSKVNKSDRVISKNTQPTLLSAEGIVSDLFLGQNDISAIVCMNETDTIGVVQVVIDLNKVGKVTVIGTGLTEEILDYIDKGIMYGSLFRSPNEMGEQSLRELHKIFENRDDSGFRSVEHTDMSVEVITKENIDFYRNLLKGVTP